MDLSRFLEELESESPAPGGGAASSLCGVISASLSLMVSRLTVGRKKYESVQMEIQKLISSYMKIKESLMKMIEEDTDAFNKISEARKLPKGSEEEIAVREKAIENAIKRATIVPYKIGRQCLSILSLNRYLIKIGNKNAWTDCVASSKIAQASLESALLNVEINTSFMKDKDFSTEYRMKSLLMIEAGREMLNYIQKSVGKWNQ
ncbi:cyclodeaminase/cyclohydrolase family protein [Caldiplasma sukawensis]